MLSTIISTPLPMISIDTRIRLPLLTTEWHRSRLYLHMPILHKIGNIDIAGVPIDEARCCVVEKAIESNAKYIFFLDWDVLVPQDTLTKLLYLADNKLEYDVFAGLYCAKSNPAVPLFCKTDKKSYDYDWTLGDKLECDIVPCGCTLIRLSVFNKLPKPWFKTTDGETEDIWFCNQVRQNKSKILIDTSIVCGHINNDTGEIFTLAQDSLPYQRRLQLEGKL